MQDDWRVSKDLTLNLGLAWSMATPISESASRQANFIPSTGQLLIAGQNYVGGSAGVKMDWLAFEPRIGFAYKLFGSDKTVLRGGYAIFHDSAWSQGAPGLWQNPPFAAESFGISFGGCTYATAACAATQTPNVGSGQMVGLADGFPVITTPPNPSTFQGNLLTQELTMDQGMMQQFNINVERQLPGNVLSDRGLCRLARRTHPQLWKQHQLGLSVGLRQCSWLHVGLRSRRDFVRGALPRTTASFTASTIRGARTTTPCRSRRKPRAANMASMPWSATLTPATTTPGFPTVSAHPSEFPTSASQVGERPIGPFRRST